MSTEGSATTSSPVTVSSPDEDHLRGDLSSRVGLVMAAGGVTSFSLTFPATTWALEGLGPWSVVTLRMLFAGLVAASALGRHFGCRDQSGLTGQASLARTRCWERS